MLEEEAEAKRHPDEAYRANMSDTLSGLADLAAGVGDRGLATTLRLAALEALRPIPT